MSAVDLSQHGAAIFAFAMEGCGACEHYVPRLIAQVEALREQGYPFVVHTEGMAMPPGSIPVLIYDAASPDVDVQRLADRFKVEATPTTVLAARKGSFKCEGNLANNQITWLLMMALEAVD